MDTQQELIFNITIEILSTVEFKLANQDEVTLVLILMVIIITSLS